MLSIGSMNPNSGQYYIELATEDYYLDGGEPPGRWAGRGATALGLAGTVDKDSFYFLLHGIAPDGSKPLVRDSAGKDHHPGWDLTFSCPKSVSVLWAMADEPTRQRIQDVQQRAVEKTLAYIEQHAAYTRRGPGGRNRKRVHLVGATFEHSTSRAQQPQLHTHALVLNVGVLEDGSTGALDGRVCYRYKMAAGAMYRASLSSGLTQELGLAVESRGEAFEIKHVPGTLTRHMSIRRAEIEQRLQERGESGARAASVAALATRQVKEHIPRQQLFLQWQETGLRFGFSRDEAQSLVRDRAPGPLPHSRDEALEAAFDKMNRESLSFTERDLVRCVAEQAPSRGLDSEEVLETVRRRLADPSGILEVGRRADENVYATLEMARSSREFLDDVERLSTDHRFDIDVVSAGPVAMLNVTMTREQADAYRHLTRNSGRVAALDGLAGTDRMHVLKASRQAWEHAGYTVLGVSPTARGARLMEENTGIRSVTLSRLLSDLTRTLTDDLRHHARQFARLAAGLPTYSPDETYLKLDSNTIVVLDRASSIVYGPFKRLVEEVDRCGAKLVVSGDRKSSGPYMQGGLFSLIWERIGGATLRGIELQREQWSRNAERAAADGNLAGALKAYAERGQVTIGEGAHDTSEQLMDRWKRVGIRAPREHIIVTADEGVASALNQRAQAQRIAAGELGKVTIQVNGEQFHRRDRVRFLKTKRAFGIEAGAMGTVLFVEPLTRNLVVWLDDGRLISVPLLVYKDVTLGYAVSASHSDDTRIRNALVLVSGEPQREGTIYQQLSRATDTTHVFIDRETAGRELTTLVQSVKRASEREESTPPSNPAREPEGQKHVPSPQEASLPPHSESIPAVHVELIRRPPGLSPNVHLVRQGLDQEHSLEFDR